MTLSLHVLIALRRLEEAAALRRLAHARSARDRAEAMLEDAWQERRALHDRLSAHRAGFTAVRTLDALSRAAMWDVHLAQACAAHTAAVTEQTRAFARAEDEARAALDAFGRARATREAVVRLCDARRDETRRTAERRAEADAPPRTWTAPRRER